MPTSELECLHGPDGCAGPVELRSPGYGYQIWPFCKRHGAERIQREHDAIGRYGNPCSPCVPSDFEPTYAGERWSQDD